MHANVTAPDLAQALHAALWSDHPPQPGPGALPLLAHYTSIHTLERIAQAGEIWFANPLYMNDVDELRYGIGLGLRVVRSHPALRRACSPQLYHVLLDAYEELHAHFEHESAFDVYVFSCSVHDDAIGDDGLLSMWRGYGHDGNGVAIVFDLSPLLGASSPLLLRPVDYLSYEESEAWMDDRVEQFARALACQPAGRDEVAGAAAALFRRIQRFALFTKHRGFHEEREWRVVYLRELDEAGLFTPYLHYLIGDRGIEPRLRFTTQPLADAGSGRQLPELVRRIILGPVAATPLALRSVVRMLELYQPRWAMQVTRSTTPYRARR